MFYLGGGFLDSTAYQEAFCLKKFRTLLTVNIIQIITATCDIYDVETPLKILCS